MSREKSLENAKRLWEQSQGSHVPARDFAKPLKNRHEESIVDIYSGKSADDARSEFAEDLQEISPFLHKKWVDSFHVLKRGKTFQVRTDETFFQWLDENPIYLTSSKEIHDKTPLEVALDGNSPEMARKVLWIAQEHGVSIARLIEPLIERYKITHLDDGFVAAHSYIQSIYDLDVPEVSQAIYEKIKKISFPS